MRRLLMLAVLLLVPVAGQAQTIEYYGLDAIGALGFAGVRQMTAKIRRALAIYDPQSGESRQFRLSSGADVSTGSSGFWVAEAQGFDWLVYARTLTDLAASADGLSYITFIPWWPVSGQVIEEFTLELRQATRIDRLDKHLIAACSGDGGPLVQDCLRLRAKLGGPKSGLWSVGQTTDLDQFLSTLRNCGPDGDSPILATAASLATIRFALCMDDGLDALFVRSKSVGPHLLDEMSLALKRDQTQVLE